MSNVFNQVIAERYAAYHGDCIEIMRDLPSDSIGYSIFSPPFSSLYCYSNSERDAGNCRDDAEFHEAFRFVLRELYRVMMPGRDVSIHCMDLPSSKQNHGFIGLRDFRGDLVRAAEEEGFIYHSNVTIWKDPVTAMQRTKAIGLLYKQLKKDSALSRQGIPDYLVTLRKRGDNPEPITHSPADLPVDEWQRLASPVWMDINPSDTLQKESARDEKDERHICLARGSLVLTKAGYVPIEEVKIGALVLTHKGRWMPVVANQCNGIRPVVKVTAQGVAGLYCTPEHRLWTRRGETTHPRAFAMNSAPEWIEARNTLGSYVNLKVPPVEELSVGAELTLDEWWVVGRYLADGHMTERGMPFISFPESKRAVLLERMGQRAGATNKTYTAYQIYIKGHGGKGGHHNDPFHQVIRKCGTGAGEKQVPVEVLCGRQEVAEALLSGYLSGDGHQDKLGRWHASSVSRPLALGMAMVAQRARGLVASVYAGRKAGSAVIQGRTVQTRDEWKLMLSPRHISAFLAEDGAWKKVRSIAFAEDSEVWDLQVAEDESFTAEGCVVHNCPLQLEVIRRGIKLWSNPGDIVLSPFGGIGSESYVALQEGRRAVTCELKDSYFKQLVQNLASAVQVGKQTSLFDLAI